MFVGDVRWAGPLGGCSWTLSGGRWLSAGPTNVSKNRQVRRATVRRKAESCSDNRGRAARSGRLSHQAAAGDTSHNAATGTATATVPHRAEESSASPSTATAAVAGTAHMVA